MKYSITTTALFPTAVLPGIRGSTAPSRSICRRTTRDIWNETETVSANGPSGSVSTHTPWPMRYLPQNPWNNRQTYRSCMGLLKLAKSIPAADWKPPEERHCPLQLRPVTRASVTFLQPVLTGQVHPKMNLKSLSQKQKASPAVLATIGGKRT